LTWALAVPTALSQLQQHPRADDLLTNAKGHDGHPTHGEIHGRTLTILELIPLEGEIR
jgi:hypothetical protein